MTILLPANDTISLEAVREFERRYGVPDMRPCIAGMALVGHSRDGVPSGEQVNHLVTVELDRLGAGQKQTMSILTELNYQNYPPLQATVLRGKVRSVYISKKTYKYSCSKVSTLGFALADTVYCVGPDMCPYFKLHPSTKGEYSGPWALFESGQVHRLTNGAALLYIGIQYAEKDKSYKPGSRLFVSHRKLADYTGLHRNSISAALDQLVEKGLIEMKPGNPRGRGHAATEIRRVLPIPGVFSLEG